MDIVKLIETLRQHGVSCVRAHGRYCSICDDAATALSTLQIENQALRNAANGFKAENEKLRAELERMKEIMRYNGIMVIPSKYPGGRSEWNIPKPRGQKEG